MVESVQRIAGAFMNGNEANVGSSPQRALYAHDGIVGIRIGAGGSSVHIHDAEFELAERTRDLGTAVDGNFLPGDGINTDLAAEKKRIDITSQGESEYPSVLQNKL